MPAHVGVTIVLWHDVCRGATCVPCYYNRQLVRQLHPTIGTSIAYDYLSLARSKPSTIVRSIGIAIACWLAGNWIGMVHAVVQQAYHYKKL